MALTPRTLHLIDPFGTGDLATVYRATDPENADRSVAVAIIHDDLKDLDGVVAALRSRVAAMATLVHPGVVVQEGVFLVSDRPALVQEMVPGVDLIRLAKVGRVEMPVAAAIIRQAALVLSALAQDGWAHGLLSPRRTLLTVSGRVKIAGFGAKAGTALVGDVLDATDRGRLRYVAPERKEGVLDHPGDVYALGAMLSLLLTGTWPKRPSRDADEQAGVAKDAADRIIQTHAKSADSVAALVARCMSSKASERPALDELASALESVATDADGLADWAGDVVPGVGGAAIDGLEELDAEALAALVADATADDISAVDSVEDSADESPENESPDDSAEDVADESPDDSAEDVADETPENESPDDSAEDVADESPDDELDDGADEHAGVEAAGDSKETATMPSIDVEDLLTIGPDDETDLADDIDTDEPVNPSSSSPVIDENADKWDRMLGLDVVPDSAENVVISDQVPQRSNFGLWIVLGLVLGGGVAWSLGLFGPVGTGTDAEVQEPSVVTPAADVAVPPPAEKEVVSPSIPETPVEPEQVPPPEAVQPVEVPEPVVPPVIEPAVETAPSSTPVPEPTPGPAPEAAPEVVPEAAAPPAAQPVGPQTGLIRVAGDAHQVRLVNAGRRYSGGRMPPGAYHIEVVFQEGEKPRVAGRINLAAGDRKLVRCAAAFYRCQVH